jgi:tRNA modification GTPase
MTLVGTLTDAETGLPMDEVVLCVFRAPASYTGEDSVEISCHGNQHGIARILRALRGTGFRDAGPGEFTLRAFLNGRIDLTMAEAVHEVVTANTETAHSLALNRLSGAVADMIGAARADLLALSSAVELELDYPEDELPENRARLVETAVRRAAPGGAR